jgi:methylase of polypeptide subunit release factors
MPKARMIEADAALLRLLHILGRRDYHFITPTPATHGRVVARPDRTEARDLEDVLGWSLPFVPSFLDAEVLALLEAGEALEPAGGGRLRSRFRVSWLKERLYLHSAYPTEAEDSVFFGPDSYRFADLVEAELTRVPAAPRARVVDIGTGAGVGAIVAAGLCRDAEVAMTDINPQALRLAGINAEAAGFAIRAIQTDSLDPIGGGIDLALANPPYIIDQDGRAYRDGGGMLGGEVSVDMARMALERLNPGGRLILYTGSAVVRGEDRLRQALERLAGEAACSLGYRELDPDVFGEELEHAAYAEADRIAVVAAVFAKA